MFDSRKEAALALARELSAYRGQHPLVLAIPRGAVEMACIIAEQLDGEADVVLVKKLGAPGNPEFAVGAVDETGWIWIADHAAQVGATADYLVLESRRQRERLNQRRRLYTPDRPPVDAGGRTVIVVDDGMATGATMMAALHAISVQEPVRLICAVPVASEEAVQQVQAHADRLVCLQVPRFFQAVGAFYRDFPQFDDAQVMQLLAAARPTPGAPPG